MNTARRAIADTVNSLSVECVITYRGAYLGMPRLHCETVCAHAWPILIVYTRALVCVCVNVCSVSATVNCEYFIVKYFG